MEDKKRAIKVSTLDELAEGFQESRGITDKLTIEQMIALAKEPVGGGENKLAQYAEGTLTEITAEDLADITSIRNEAFMNYYGLKHLVIPPNVKTVGERVFLQCGELETAVISDGVESIGKSVFSGCGKLANVKISKDITSIPESAFLGTGVQEITLSNNITSIGNMAFWYCQQLKSVRIGNGITSIGSNVFQYTGSLTDIYIDKPEGSISGSPWGSPLATIHWNTPLPNNG